MPSPKLLLYSAIIFLFGLFLYSGVLTIGIPSLIYPLLLSNDSTFLFIIIILVLYLAYRPSGWIGVLSSFSTTLVIFSILLSSIWRRAESSTFILGGLLPVSDAQDYYESALRLLEGYPFLEIASWRPLAHGVLATLLGITGQNLQVTLAIFALITAISCFYFTREIRRTHGTFIAVLSLTIIILYYRFYIGRIMTENLGLALGTVGTALLWRGATNQKINLSLLGIFLLTLALNTRAGAFLILPALIGWGTLFFRGESRFSSKFFLGGVSVVLLGFIINSIVFKVTAAPDALSNGNFAYTVYGLAVGGMWDSVLLDYPELLNLNSEERQDKIYLLAWKAFRDNPLILGGSLLKAWKIFIWDNFIFSYLLSPLLNGILKLLSLVALFNFYQQRNSAIASLMLWVAVGVLISVPFVPPWDALIRPYAATIPFFSLFPALGLSFIAHQFKLNFFLKTPSDKTYSLGLCIFAIALASLTLLGPITTKLLSQAAQFSEIPCSAATEALYFRNSPGSNLNFLADATLKQTNIPNIRLSDFRAAASSIHPYYQKIAEELTQVNPNTTYIQKINLKNGQMFGLIINSEQLTQKQGIIAVCAIKKTSVRRQIMNKTYFDLYVSSH
ncbi:hypothetical protein [Gloeothece verrucosa]|uniref:Glycosyltransferase RgtA/B/C/D-like domain-containing protein n=1 Tax=Gloeothece verrucosa (strain PCC 7822) TaxID=497965 RepID=E0UI59_GLOV7|nr:hypothetical protein [Gloeothece verrucosa]ADN15711.1 hypothetical protein Cyan7822_3776 [Gloeothece verrucosa PCC 7822]